jgi:hypothetical protein
VRGASQGAAAPWVRPHRQHHLSGPPRSGGCMAVCGGGSRWLPKISAPKPSYIHYIRRARLTSTTHTTFQPLSLHLYFTIFSSVVRSLARLVIQDQDHLEDVWYDQYNVLHCDSVDAGPTGFRSGMTTSRGPWPGPRTGARRGAASAIPNPSRIGQTSWISMKSNFYS